MEVETRRRREKHASAVCYDGPVDNLVHAWEYVDPLPDCKKIAVLTGEKNERRPCSRSGRNLSEST